MKFINLEQEEKVNKNSCHENTKRRSKYRRVWGDDNGYDVAVVQHAKGASLEEETDDNGNDEKQNESGGDLGNGKENM
jgi:hypothetical protein